ncbi:hypothetical protein [Amycolatopsis suaedae]|uniref:WD40 repeat domain-containing protein n=1 Tax=Amycolatopsis suaedae TaxID=2510978 RepID=A0A4V2EMH1_9PSEU|nr:hypothetical protein [Amycolatopsis suaedae]RZQ65045.1 hypothetical protein EWH70_03840 [Amycolatopsis suaedae]
MRVLVVALVLLLAACTEPPPPQPVPPDPEPGPLAGAPAPAGLRLLFATAPPVVFDVGTGVATPVPAAPPGDRLTSVFRAGSTSVLLSAERCGATCVQPAEIFLLDGPHARSIGQARSAAPTADGRGLWLVRHEGEVCRLVRAGLDGTETSLTRPSSCDTGVRAETSAGLLITVRANRQSEQSAQDVLVDPATGRTLRQRGRVLGMAGDQVLFTELTGFTLLDQRTGVEQPLPDPLPSGEPGDALTSPDGRYLAVPFGDPAWRGTSTQVFDVWLLDLAARRWIRAPSMPVSARLKHQAVDWAPDGSLVLAGALGPRSASGDPATVVGRWQPGAEQWQVAQVRLPENRGQSMVVLS